MCGEQMTVKYIPVVCIVGPTAVGKTELSLLVAEQLGSEIVSADSMQVYRHMNIGTAKLPPHARRGIVHHMLDIAEPWESFTVHDYAAGARAIIAELARRGKVPVVVGGTGLYIRALVDGYDFTATSRNDALRADLEKESKTYGGGYLHDRLEALDADAAGRIHPHDTRRIIRALEIVLGSGQPVRENYQSKGEDVKSDHIVPVLVGLNALRPDLYARINHRVDTMIAQGLADEVRALLDMGCTQEHTSMQAIGYKELVSYVQGECSLEEAVGMIKQASRRYAKRQLSWFRADRRIEWYVLQEDDMMLSSSELVSRISDRLERLRSQGIDKPGN